MSLADQIANRNEDSSSTPNVDEFGIPVPDPETPEYWVARTLCRFNRESDHSVHCIHYRNGALYLGHTALKEDKDTFYKLTGLRHKIQDWERVAFYEVLQKYAPVFSRKCIQVADNLFWSLADGELLTYNEIMKRGKNG